MRWAPLCLLLGGCAFTQTAPPPPSALYQQLPSSSAEEAARGLNLRLPKGAKVFLDTSFCDPNEREVFGIVRRHLGGQGLALVDKPDADYIIELVIRANGIDAEDKGIGIPATVVPAGTMHTGVPALAVPEISVWSEHTKVGVTELEVTVFDAHTHLVVTAVGPIYAKAQVRSRHILSGFVTGTEMPRPGIVAMRP